MSDILLEATAGGEQLTLAGAGAWIAENAHSLEAQIDAETGRPGTIKRVDIDMGRVDRLDTFGAWLLERLTRSFSARGCDTRVTGLREDYRALMDELRGIKTEQAPARHRDHLTETLAAIGVTISAVGRSLAAIINMLGALALALLRVAARPRTFRFTSMVHQLEMSAGARCRSSCSLPS